MSTRVAISKNERAMQNFAEQLFTGYVSVMRARALCYRDFFKTFLGMRNRVGSTWEATVFVFLRSVTPTMFLRPIVMRNAKVHLAYAG